METRGKGFNIRVEKAAHLITIRLWGRWTSEIGEDYLAECRRILSDLPDDRDASWAVLLDLTGYVLSPPETQDCIARGFGNLRTLSLSRQAILLHGPIIHLPGLASAQTKPLVSSYFQSEEEALEWLKGACASE